MKTIVVLHATREGQTRRIAEHVAATLRARDTWPMLSMSAENSPRGSLCCDR
jgi:menaquinone-dependent protoporphyrinogen IX oxidase